MSDEKTIEYLYALEDHINSKVAELEQEAEPEPETHAEAVVQAAAYLDSIFAIAQKEGCNLHFAVDADSNTLTIVVSDAANVFSITKDYDGSALMMFDGMMTEIGRAYVQYVQTGNLSPSVVVERIGELA